jgi:hypothetical protein
LQEVKRHPQIRMSSSRAFACGSSTPASAPISSHGPFAFPSAWEWPGLSSLMSPRAQSRELSEVTVPFTFRICLLLPSLPGRADFLSAQRMQSCKVRLILNVLSFCSRESLESQDYRDTREDRGRR